MLATPHGFGDDDRSRELRRRPPAVALAWVERETDVVMFIYRDELDNPESPDRGVAEVIVAKHRSGPTGTERLAFLDRYTRFAIMARV